MDLQKGYLTDPVETIYLGGGTPSLLDPQEINQILETVRQNYALADNPEVTLEANPNNVTTENLHAWMRSGINRLSIGVQSFSNGDLQFLNRSHSAEQAINSIKLAQQAGIHNLNIDLIFGIPDLMDFEWLINLKKAVDMGIPHISPYALTVEPQTSLDLFIRKGELPPVDEDQTARQFCVTQNFLTQEGYLQYEVSNYCLPGQFSKHNTAYWQGKHYLGLGPSAHSFNGTSRQWNTLSISHYISQIENNHIPFDKEDLTPLQHCNEYIMTSLRTMWGCNLKFIETHFGAERKHRVLKAAQIYLHQKLLTYSDDTLFLAKEAKLFADGIAAGLFCDD